MTIVNINGSVGKGGRNFPADVKTIQQLLNASPVVTNKLIVDGQYGPRTYQAILQFQMSIFPAKYDADGVVDAGGRTLKALNNPGTRPIKTVKPQDAKTHGNGTGGHAPLPPSAGGLTDADFLDAAKALGGVEPAMIRAFAEVESGGKSGFGANGFPKIAYEGHVFRKLTNGAYDKTYPLLSYKYVRKAGPEWQANNKDDATSQDTLNKAAKLDQGAAYQACSWGMFQVMGFNFAACGYASVFDFVAAMKAGERGQLDAFVGFCNQSHALRNALLSKNFAQCAANYNGSDYGDYDSRISKAYRKYSGT